jgi:hypothetical protein
VVASVSVDTSFCPSECADPPTASPPGLWCSVSLSFRPDALPTACMTFCEVVSVTVRPAVALLVVERVSV